MAQSIHDLWYGFSVAIQPGNFLWCVFGVLIGNLVGVLPGMGALATLAILLPLTYSIPVIPAILMLSGIFYGSMYGGAIGAILLNLPSHPPHAVTCLDGYPLTLQNRGGAALGIAMIASFFAASVGILIMVFVFSAPRGCCFPVWSRRHRLHHASGFACWRDDGARIAAAGYRHDIVGAGLWIGGHRYDERDA